MEPDEFAVKYLVICSRVEHSAGLGSPYSLREVRYSLEVPPDREWPVRLDELWVFVRFYNGTESRRFTLAVVWLDSPGGEIDIAYFDLAGYFREGQHVMDRGWNVSVVRYPGRYVFRLTDDVTGDVLADDYVQIRRLP